MNFRLVSLALGLAVILPFRATADVITDWNNMLLQTFAQEGQNVIPPTNSGAMGMMAAAMFDAVNSVNRNFSPYTSYDSVPGSTSKDAAAAQAGYDVLISLYGANSFYASNFQAMLNSQLSVITDTTARNNGVSLGTAAASGMIAARTGDGSTAATTWSSQPANTPGAWQLGNNAGAWGATSGTFLKSQWGYVTPFTMSSGDQFRTLSPSGTSTWSQTDVTTFLASSAYTAAFEKVRILDSCTRRVRPRIKRTSLTSGWTAQAQHCARSLGLSRNRRQSSPLCAAQSGRGGHRYRHLG